MRHGRFRRKSARLEPSLKRNQTTMKTGVEFTLFRNTSFRRLAPALLLLLGLCVGSRAWAQSYVLSNLWSVAAGAPSHPFLADDDRTRGLAYNPATGHVLVASRTSSNAVYVLDGNTGAILGTLPYDTNVINGGTFHVNLVSVTDDGVIYVGNLTTDAIGSGPFKLYRWANETAPPQLVYSGDPSAADAVANNRRFGDSMTLRGTGTGTQILLGTLAQNAALLTTADGTNFTATKITTDAASGDLRYGLAWGAGNTFWAKQAGGNLKLFTLNLPGNSASVTLSVSGVIGGPLGVDVTRNLLAIVEASNTTSSGHKLRLYDISDPTLPVQLDTTRSFPAANTNGNLVGAVSIRNGKLFALETDNGILAYNLAEIYLPPTITTPPASVTVWEGAAFWTFSVVAAGTKPFSYQWFSNSVPIPGATAATYTISNVNLSHQAAYSVTVSNSAGSATSSAALLTVQPGNPSPIVTNIWNLAAGSRPYLTANYREYGVAINPLTTNVIVVTRQNPTNMIAVLDIQTGAHKHYIDYSGLTLAGSIPMNKVDIAEDGVIYVCNLTTDTASTPLVILGFSDDNPMPALKGVLFSGDPGNGLTPSSIGWGANIAVRGSGPNTEILLGAGKYSPTPLNARAVAILRPDPITGVLSSTPIIVTNAPDNQFRFGLSWGPGTNTFWAKAVGSLMLVQFDETTQTGWVVKTYPTSGARSVPSSVTGIRYDPATGLLAGLQNGSPPTPVSVPVYDVTDVNAGPLWVDQELFTSYNADIEYQGNVDFAAGYLVALGVNNGLKAFRVNGGTLSLPVILQHPSSGTWYRGTSPTLSVVADSATPLSYQWYFEGSPIPNATNATLTLANIQTNQAGNYVARVINAGGYRDSAPALITVIEAVTSSVVTNLWTLAPGSRPYLTTNYQQYGMAFNPARSNLLIASYDPNTTAATIAVLDALTGTEKHLLDVSVVSGGNRWLNKIGVADDGVVYAANRTTTAATVPFTVYRWANDDPTTIATVAFSGDPFPTLYPNGIAGYQMDVRGAGTNTELLLSAYTTNVVAVLTTANGTNFTTHEILVPGVPPRFARIGICFGVGNTFWAKTWRDDGGKLYLVSYDLGTGLGTVLRTYDVDVISSTVTTVAYNDSLKLLAGIARDDQKNVQIYNIANLDLGPQLVDQEFFPTYNASIEANGALDFGGNTYLFALNENNGVLAMLINPNYAPPVSAFRILNVTRGVGTLTLEWEAQPGAKYQVQAAGGVSGPWQNLGNEITANGPTASYTDNVSGVNQRFYRVLAK